MRASVVGATGYVGGELVRLLIGHPEISLVHATSRKHAGRPVGHVHPNLRHTDLQFSSPDKLEPVDVAFVALPRGAFGAAPDPVHAHARTIVDLSPDFRDPDIACSAGYVIGLPELYRDTIHGATRISVPGCMATAATLALRPLVVSGFVQGDVIVDARTGSSGGGIVPSEASHHAERQNAFRVYSPAGHRHEPEIAHMCGVRARMTVTAVPTVRGVQAVLHVRTPRPVTRDQVWSAYRDVYTSEPFVRIVAQRSGVHRLPDPQFLAGSNFTDIGFEVDADGYRIVAVAALDNLVKGAAGGGVQSFNVAHGLPEDAGLGFPGLHPAA